MLNDIKLHPLQSVCKVTGQGRKKYRNLKVGGIMNKMQLVFNIDLMKIQFSSNYS